MRKIAVGILLAMAAAPSFAAPIALPMKRGFYAMEGTSCAAAAKSYDRGMAIVGNDFQYGDGGSTLTAIKKTGADTYLLTFTYTDEADKPHHFTAPVKLLPKGYWIKNSMATGTWLFCSATVPTGWGE